MKYSVVVSLPMQYEVEWFDCYLAARIVWCANVVRLGRALAGYRGIQVGVGLYRHQDEYDCGVGMHWMMCGVKS